MKPPWLLQEHSPICSSRAGPGEHRWSLSPPCPSSVGPALLPGCCNAQASRSPSKTSTLFTGSLLALKRGCTLHNGPLLAIRGPMPGRSMLLSARPQRANEHFKPNGSGLPTGREMEAAPERPLWEHSYPSSGEDRPQGMTTADEAALTEARHHLSTSPLLQP